MKAVTKVTTLALAMLVGGFVFACDNDDDFNNLGPTEAQYSAVLSAASEIPTPTGSPMGSGTASVTLSTNKVLTVTVTVSGNLTSGVTMAHIHGPASPTSVAGILLDFVPSMMNVIAAGARTGTIVSESYNLGLLGFGGSSPLKIDPDTLIALLNSGKTYVNVHTATNNTGEIRGQLSRVP